MTDTEALTMALAWYDSGLEVREEFQEMIESILAQPQQEQQAQQEPDYAWPTVADYEKDVGIEVNQAFKMAWNMARTTNKMMGITSPPQRKPLTDGEIDAVRSETPPSAGLEVEGRSGDYPIPYRKLFPLQSPQPQQQQPIYKYCDDGKVIFTNPEILSQRPNKKKNT